MGGRESSGFNVGVSVFSSIVLLAGVLIVAPAWGADNVHSRLKKDFLKGYKLTQEGKVAKAVGSLEKVRDVEASIRDYVLFTLGRAYRGLKRCDEARRAFAELAENYPDSRWFALADTQARSVEACPPLEVSNDVFEIPSPGDLNCEAFSGKGQADCWFDARQYRKAKDLYLSLSPDPETLVRISQAAARTQDFDTAIRANEDLRRKFPKSREAQEALRKIAFLHQDSGDFVSAIDLLKELAAKSRLRPEKRLYFEKMGWCHFRLEQYDQAVGRYEDALAQEETPRVLYWKGRSLERLGRNQEAERDFEEIARTYAGTYYGIRSAERLGSRLHGGKTSVAATLESWWSRLPGGLSWDRWTTSAEGSRDLGRVRELTALGLLEEAADEARRARIRLGLLLPQDPKKIRQAGDGRYLFEVRGPKAEDADYRIPYADHLFSEVRREFGSAAIIDPLLLYAMMRQESRFREAVVSPAGAVGLLQIMPSTGRKLAREAGWVEYRHDWLYDPLTNIDLAVRYMKKLSDLFEGRWYAVAASYNAGEHVVSEWLKRRNGLLEEEFIEEIPYQETRDYVMKVYTNWKAYQVIYGSSVDDAGSKGRAATASR